MTRLGSAALALGAALLVLLVSPAPSRAVSLGPLCSVAGFVNGLAGRACTVVARVGPALGKAKRAVTGARTLGAGRSLVGAAALAGLLTAFGAQVTAAARWAMRQTGRFLAATTTPRLTVPWFTTAYWRVAGIAALLTVPFLAAAAVQAVLSGDLVLLLRAGLGYLPLALLAVGLLAPLAALALAATDVMCGLVSSAAGVAGGSAIATAPNATTPALGGSNPLIDLLVAAVVVTGSVVLWLELLVREAAVDVVVLLMPLTFAAMVWPARRIWAVRAVELLLALVLGKFVVVAVLSLGAGALGHPFAGNGSGLLMGAALLGLAAFAPWAVLRLVPFAEVASAAAISLRGELSRPAGQVGGRAAELLPGGRTSEDAPDAAGPPESQTAAARAVAGVSAAERASAGGDPAPGGERGGAFTGGGEAVGSAPPDGWAPAQELVAARPAGSPAAAGAPGGPPRAGSLPGPAGAGAAGDPPDAGPGPAGSAADGVPPVPGERIPGLPAMWQAEDMSWRPIEFGPGAEWPPRLVDLPEGADPGPPLPPPTMGLPEPPVEEDPCDGR